MKTLVRITLAAALAWSASAAAANANANDDAGIFGFGLPSLAEIFGWGQQATLIGLPPPPPAPPQPSIPPGVLPGPGPQPGDWWGSCQRVGNGWICHQN